MFPSSRTKYSVLITIFVIVVMMGATFASTRTPIASNSSGGSGPSVTSIHHNVIAPITGDTQAGFDCGLGTTSAIVNATGFPVAPSENGSPEILSSCTWIGDLALSTPGTVTDTSTEPLVTDQDESLSLGSANIGGGFTADIVVLQNSTASINGFDFQVLYNPTILRAVEFDQGGLPWTPAILLTAKSTIDNTQGIAELAQVITGSAGSNVVIFRIRFDVIGIGNTGLRLVDQGGGLTNPGSVVHVNNPGAFNAESFYDSGNTLQWWANFTQTNAVTPGGSNTFSAKVQGGTGPYSYAWQFDSCNQLGGIACTLLSEATTNPATVTLPFSATASCASPSATNYCGYRVDLRVTDSLSHSFDIVQHIPLTATEKDTTASQVAGTAQSIAAFWVGGVSPYSGTQRFCPGIGPNTICTLPTVALGSTPTQSVSRSVTYHFAGVYADTLSISDSNTALFGGKSTSSFTLLLNVTGTPALYTITIRPSTTSTTINTPVNFLAWANYTGGVGGVTPGLRGTSITLTFNFGDSGSGTAKITMATHGLNQTTFSHTYISASPAAGYTVLAIGADSTVSTVGETSNRVSIQVVAQTPLTAMINCPTSGTVGTPVACTASATGGTGPYTFAWTATGGSPATGSGTSFGPTYSVKGSDIISVTATDSLSATNTASATVTIAALTLTTAVTCPASSTVGQSITCTTNTSGGTTPYHFAWAVNGLTNATATGSSFSTTFTVKGTDAIAVTVTDSNSKTASASTSVTINPLALAATINCPATGTVGSAVACTASATGGTSPYTFVWTATGGSPATGTTTSFSTSYSVKGTYTISVVASDSNTKTATASATVTVAPLALAASISCPSTGTVGTPVACSASATGGTAPYTFAWTATGGSPATGSGTTFSTTYNVKGTFTISIIATDGNAKTAPASTTVTISPLTLAVSVSGPNSATTAQSVTFTATASGGTIPYHYAWSVNGVANATAISATFSTTITTAGAATVSVTVTDANVKTASNSASITITNAQALAVAISCPATGTVGTAISCTATGSGGTVPYTFAWITTGGSPASGTGTTFSTTYSVKGSFTISVTVTDSATHTASNSATVAISPLALGVTVSGPVTLIVGQSATYTATASGGTTAYHYAWSVNGVTNITATSATFSTTFKVKGTMTVSVTVTDANAKTASGSMTTTVAPLALVASIQCPTTGAVGTTVACTASATGGTAPYTFAWTATGGSPASGTGLTFTTTYNVKGTYTISVTATDGNAKTAPASATVTVSPLTLAVTVSGPSAATTVQSVTFTASASGGTTPYKYAWSVNGVVNSTATSSTFSTTFTSVATDTVSVTVTDTNAKTASNSASITITSGQALAVSIACPTTGTVGTAVACNATGTGGTAPYTFAWTATGGSPASGTGSTFSTTYSVKGSFTISVTVTDSAAHTASNSATVAINPLTLSVTINCPGTGTVGTAISCNASATGGTSPYTFAWSATGGSPASGSGSTFTTTYNAKGTYTVAVTVTDTNSKTASVTTGAITISPLALAATASCPATGTVGTGVACTASATGGTTPYTFAWTATGGTPASGSGTSFSTTYNVKGTYTISVTATDGNSKTATASATVTVSPITLGVTVTGPSTAKSGTSVTFTAAATGGTAPYKYAWSVNGVANATATSGAFSTTFSSTGSDTISVTVTDANAKTASNSATITITSAVNLAIVINCPATGTVGTPVSCTAVVTGGTAPFAITWIATGGNPSTGSGTSFATTYSMKGTFTISATVTDSASNTASASATITISPLALVATITCPTSGTAGTMVSCTATATGGTVPYTFSWTATGGNPSAGSGSSFATTYGTKGTYTVATTVSDANTKTASATATISIAPLALSAGFTFTPTAPTNGTTVTFTATVTGGTSPYTYRWGFGDSTSGTGNPVNHGFAAGNFTVTLNVTDANGVSKAVSHTITVTPTTTGKPYLLTFSAFSADDFNNGVGQLQVLVNGHLVVDIPAGLNHLTGTGDYLPYENTWVKFGPFDITAFIIHGQNNITFTDRNPADHFTRVRDVLIVQGTTVFLNVPRNVGIYPGFSKTYTFSNPPLVLTSFTATPANPNIGQNVTFTAFYTGGTAPFRCIFFFSDFHITFVTGSLTSCSTTRHFSYNGNFTAIVIVIGSSTSDIVTGHLLVPVGTGIAAAWQPEVSDAALAEIDL